MLAQAEARSKPRSSALSGPEEEEVKDEGEEGEEGEIAETVLLLLFSEVVAQVEGDAWVVSCSSEPVDPEEDEDEDKGETTGFVAGFEEAGLERLR